MQDQTSPRDAAAELNQLERVVLQLPLGTGSPGILAEREVAQAIGSEAHAANALISLHASGLIHRLEEFVFATRAAVRCRQLEKAGWTNLLRFYT